MVEGIGTSVHELYYHAVSKQLFVGNYKEGILIYDVGKQENHPLSITQQCRDKPDRCFECP